MFHGMDRGLVLDRLQLLLRGMLDLPCRCFGKAQGRWGWGPRGCRPWKEGRWPPVKGMIPHRPSEASLGWDGRPGPSSRRGSGGLDLTLHFTFPYLPGWDGGGGLVSRVAECPCL